MTIQEIRSKCLAEEVSATLLAKRAGINRPRLSLLEYGHLSATSDELRRLEVSLNELIAAKNRVIEVALQVGWPTTAVGF
jgi:hypothetical protein